MCARCLQKRRARSYNLFAMKRVERVKRAATTDLTRGNVWKILLLYCLPIFGSAMVQQLYSLVDLLVVGNFAAQSNLAVNAVGNATTIVNILLAFALGANAGCAVTVAKYFGAKNYLKVKETVNTSAVTFSVLCAAAMALGFAFGDLSMDALSVDGSYRADCLTYLYVYAGSLPFVFLYNIGCGICSALGDSKTPFIFLVISSLLNVVLDLLFVCVFHWDVAGAAWATFISQAISAVLTVFVLLRKLGKLSCEEKPKFFVKSISRDLMITSVPVILQNAFVSVGNFFVSKRINDIGLDATTGFTAAFKLISMANVGVSQMTSGLANFCSQNKAVGEYGRIVSGFCAVLVYCLVTNALFMTAFLSAPAFFTRLFVDADKLTAEALAYSCNFIVIVTSFLPVVCVKIVCDGVVRGCGGNLGFTVSTFSDLILRVALVYLLVPPMGFQGVSWAWAIGWVLGMLVAVGFFLAIPCLRSVFYKKRPRGRESGRDDLSG